MRFFKGFIAKPTVILAIISFFVVATFSPKGAWATVERTNRAISNTSQSASVSTRDANVKIVTKHLVELGLSRDEVAQRVASLTDEDLRFLAKNTKNTYPGAGGITIFLVFTAIILIFGYAYLKATGHHVVIQ